MLKIRLSRVGRKKQPFFKIVVIPKSAPPKGGRFRDEVGTHDPVNKETIIDADRARGWIAKGAQPSDTVHNLFIKHGIITGKKIEVHAGEEPIEAEPEKEEKAEEEPKKEEKKEEKAEKTEEKQEEKPEEKEVKKEKSEPKKEEKKEDKPEEKEKKEEKEVKKEKSEEKPKKEDKEEAKEEKKEDKGGKGLDSLDLTTRIINALEDAGIDTVEKLKKKSKEELAEVDGLGEKSIEKITEELK